MELGKNEALSNVFGRSIYICPPEEYTNIARRYLMNEVPDKDPDQYDAKRQEGLFLTVVASWLNDIGLRGAKDILKREAPNGKLNWLENIADGKYTSLPESLSRRDEIMFVIVKANEKHFDSKINPDNIPYERRGRFAPPAEVLTPLD